MTRVVGWESRYLAVIRSRVDHPWVWGEHDCSLFAADLVQAITLEDPAAWFRGRYYDLSGAVRALREFIGAPPNTHPSEALVTTAAKLLGPEVSLLKAKRGDVVLVTGVQPLGVALGVVVENHEAIVAANPGVGRVDLAVAGLRAWRV